MDFDHPPSDPVKLFNEWLEEAKQTNLPNPNAMSLATVDADGRPSCRIVLLKGFDNRGAVFFTNHNSRKGAAMHTNPYAALTFHWDVLDRQVRIEGRVNPTTEGESDAYFAMRPRGARIGAWASQQSELVGSRAELEQAVQQVEMKYPGDAVPRPPHWGGYRVSLDRMEFWQGRRDRLHDRIVYTLHDGSWQAQRLQP